MIAGDGLCSATGYDIRVAEKQFKTEWDATGAARPQRGVEKNLLVIDWCVLSMDRK